MIKVRVATVDDIGAVAGSELESFPDDAWTADYLAAVVDGQLPTVQLLVAELSATLGASGSHGDPQAPKGQTVAGHALVSVLFEDAELQRIAAVPSYRRHGVGRTLLHAAFDLARDQGAERMLLEVRETNVEALTLYRDEGFVEIDRRVGYYRDGTTGIVLERSLL